MGPGGRHGWLRLLPAGWERTEPDPTVVDRWQPGMALAAVMGHVVDGLDVDPRNGGLDSLTDITVPRTYGVQATPSGGWHGLIAPLGTGSRDNVRAGVDLKGGRPDGTGRGFLWIAPTVKLSKATGEIAAYAWSRLPDLDGIDGDRSGEALAEVIRALRAAPAHDIGDRLPPAGCPDRLLMGLVEVVLRAKEGERNACLHWAACRAAEHSASGRLDWLTAERALSDAATDAGLSERETAATLKSGRRVAS